MEEIVKILYGSHLYGTDTKHSDRDYKGVYIPGWRDIILSKVGKSFAGCCGTDKDLYVPSPGPGPVE